MAAKGNDSDEWLKECEVRAIQNMTEKEQKKILKLIKANRSEASYNSLVDRIASQDFELLSEDKKTKLNFPK